MFQGFHGRVLAPPVFSALKNIFSREKRLLLHLPSCTKMETNSRGSEKKKPLKEFIESE